MPFEIQKNRTVEDLTKVPEKYRGLYEEGQGEGGEAVFTLSASVSPLVDDITSLSKNLAKARSDNSSISNESASRRHMLKAIEEMAQEWGLTVDEENDLVAALKGHIKDLAGKVEGGKDLQINLDKIKAEAEKRIREVTDSKDQEISKRDRALHKHLIGDVATAAITKAKGSVPLLKGVVESQCRVVQDGDNYVVRIVDEQGDFRFDGQGNPLSVASLVEEIKHDDDYGRAFESEAKGGTGTPPGAMNRSAPRAQQEMSSVDKISAGLAKKQYQRGRPSA